MRFLARPSTLFLGRLRAARTMSAWRAAADLVWARWEALRDSTPERRAGAFAAYLRALDAEAAAAASLADLHPTNAV